MKKNFLKKSSLLVTLGLLLVFGGVYWWWQQRNTKVEAYREVPVVIGDLDVSIQATGTVQPKNRLEIKAPVAGRIEQILVEEGQKITKGQILAWMSSTERAAMLDAARSQGPEEYKKWSELYLATPVMAPISGTLILRNVEPGQTFTTADAIFVLSDRLTVKAQVDETDIAQIKLKQDAQIILDAYPEKMIPAIVDQIAFDATTVSNVTTYIVDVVPKQTPEFFRSGMTANVTFYVASKKGVLLVPSEALKVSEGKTMVLLKASEGQKGGLRNIRVGSSDGHRTEVLEGLQEGDVVLSTEFKGVEKSSETRNPFAPTMPSRRGTRR
ncbi:MAG: efflux RND transporter periplasmic adaptor subunit [Bdellovibrio sp.]|nr:efflux RND transporter periplasmic adaptor subunit [Bdellovibrio sp.]